MSGRGATGPTWTSLSPPSPATKPRASSKRGSASYGEINAWTPYAPLYTAIHSWTVTSTSLSLTLCSLISAHHSLQALLSALLDAVPHSPSWQSLLSLIFSSKPALPGLLSLEEARELKAAIERCPVLCACVCRQIEGRFQGSGGAVGGRRGAGTAKAEGGERHLTLLARLLDVAAAQWEQRSKPLKERQWPSLLPHLPQSAAVREGLSYAASAVLLPDHQAGLERGRAALLGHPQAEERKGAEPPPQPLPPHSAAVEEAEEEADAAIFSPPFLSSSDFDWPSLPPLPAEVDCAVVLSSPLPLNDAVDVASLQAELSSSMEGARTRQWLLCRTAFTALFSPASPLPSLSALTWLYRQLHPPTACVRMGREQQLLVQLRGCVAERLQRAQVWLAHCARLLSTSRDGEGGTDRAGRKSDWLGAVGVGHLAVVRGVLCRCPPLLSLDQLALPSLAVCSAPHGRDLTSLLKPRFAVCCVAALLQSTALSAVELGEMRGLLVGAKRRTDSWARRVHRLLCHRPAPQRPTAAAPAAGGAEATSASPHSAPASSASASPSPHPRVGVSTLLGLYSEGAALLFSESKAVPALQRRLRELLDFQDTVRTAAPRMRTQMERIEQQRLQHSTHTWTGGERRKGMEGKEGREGDGSSVEETEEAGGVDASGVG